MVVVAVVVATVALLAVGISSQAHSKSPSVVSVLGRSTILRPQMMTASILRVQIGHAGRDAVTPTVSRLIQHFPLYLRLAFPFSRRMGAGEHPNRALRGERS